MPNVLHPFRRKNPRARIPKTAFSEPSFLALLNKNGLMLHQSVDLLERLGRSERMDEMKQRLARTTD